MRFLFFLFALALVSEGRPLIQTRNARVARGHTAADAPAPTITNLSTNIAYSGKLGEATAGDKIFGLYLTAQFRLEKQIGSTKFTITTSTPSVVSILGLKVIPIAVGDAVCRLTSNGVTYPLNFSVTSEMLGTPPQPAQVFDRFVSGSLSQHATAQVESRLTAAGTPDAVVNRFVFHRQMSIYKADGTLNPDCWAAAIRPKWLSIGPDWRGALIAPDIVLTANHVSNGSPMTWTWKDAAGVSYTASATASAFISYDTRIYKLTSPISSNIGFAKVIPPAWLGKFSGGSEQGVAVVVSSQDNKLVPSFCYGYSVFYANRTDGWKGLGANGLSSTWVSGDSSSALMSIVNDEFVLHGMAYEPQVASCVISDDGTTRYNAINAAMSALGSSYQMTPVNVSGFTSF